MKRFSLVLIALAAMLGMLVPAAHGQQSRSGSRPEIVSSAFSAEITGTVKSVSEKSGKLVLETADGPVNVTFPAEAVQGIKEGHQVTVAVGLVKPPPSASPRTSPTTKTK